MSVFLDSIRLVNFFILILEGVSFSLKSASKGSVISPTSGIRASIIVVEMSKRGGSSTQDSSIAIQ